MRKIILALALLAGVTTTAAQERIGQAEIALADWFADTYNHVQIDNIARNLVFQEYMNSRKIDRQKLRDFFRNQL